MQKLPADTLRLTGTDRYSYGLTDEGFFAVYDHEDAEYVANANGVTGLTERDARDLWLEYTAS